MLKNDLLGWTEISSGVLHRLFLGLIILKGHIFINKHTTEKEMLLKFAGYTKLGKTTTVKL